MSDTIRIATAEDGVELHRLIQAAYQPLRALRIPFTAITADVDLVRQKVRRHTTFVVERNAAIIATVSVRFPWPIGENHLTSYPFIHWFAVSPHFKRQSIGTALLDHVELNFLRDQIKAPAVYLATATRHPWLAGIYERRGYEAFYKHIKDDDEMVFLRKILNPELYDSLETAEFKRFEPESLEQRVKSGSRS
jgi:GNAT superfamily N-acetyltransferase